ncbi:MFS transporter (plasmid) [Paracoccus versutus]|uniref:PAT family beta-lactamase induction signal transducer AmpG n=2 Tax=Paracoccus versutus TaxID=34007 RepID=A0AAQ0KJV3_PARVE|nr:PAT family beta-lactamase induction signal transducer AmpG [Paracoccus versutus]WEJ80117.1 MFS transporter [Paracoccus versutus]
MTSPPPPAPSSLSMTGSSADRLRRYQVLAMLYLAQGVPCYVLVAAVPPILRQQGVSRATIGMLSLLLLPLALKFLWAPLIERFRPLPLGPRRAWILPTQLGSAACVLGLGMIQPTDIPALVVIALALILLTSTQDIATDGYAVLSLRPEERPTGNAIQGGAVAASVLVGGTLSLVLYQHIGWRATMTVMAGLTLLPLLVLPLMHEDAAPPLARPRPSLRRFMARLEAVSMLGLALFYRASEGLVKTMEGPYLVDAGMPLDWIGYLSGAAAATAGLGGSALAALSMRRRGAHGRIRDRATGGADRPPMAVLF